MTAPANQLITVFGGSGFIGRHVVRALAKRGYRVRVACRRPELAFFLQPLGNVGQIQAVQANLRFPASIAAAVKGADAIVNLVGILTEDGKQRFESVQAEGAAAIANAAKAEGITRFVQMSAIGADAQSESVYAQTKAAGEQAVLAAIPSAVILRPSIVFGPEDSFFNRFASLARFAPALPLVGGGETQFQPVFVGDVAEAVARGVDGTLKGGTIYELGGPQVATFKQLLQFVCATTGRKRALVPLPFSVARVQASVMEALKYASFGLLPEEFLLTRDQVTLLEKNNVVSDAAKAEGRTLEGMGITPDTYETIAPTYLYRFRKTGQFDTARA